MDEDEGEKLSELRSRWTIAMVVAEVPDSLTVLRMTEEEMEARRMRGKRPECSEGKMGISGKVKLSYRLIDGLYREKER